MALNIRIFVYSCPSKATDVLCVHEIYESKITKSEIRRVYSKYCKKHRVSGVSDRSIKATLQEMFGVSEEYATVFGTNKQENHWIGVKFRENFNEN
jgi:hypothetical protein